MPKSDIEIIISALQGMNQFRCGDDYNSAFDEIAQAIEYERDKEAEIEKAKEKLWDSTDHTRRQW